MWGSAFHAEPDVLRSAACCGARETLKSGAVHKERFVRPPVAAARGVVS